ncbi:hypothetical protein BH10ACT9_BH10ACT9_27350 [soil metagenome]
MNDTALDVRTHPAVARSARVAIAMVFAVAALDWVGWATGIGQLTRLLPTWPPMTPWTALLLAALSTAILLQSGQPSDRQVLIGRVVAGSAAVVAVAFLTEFVTGTSFGLDQMWFGAAVRALQSTWPGRPSPQTAWSLLALGAAAALIRVDRRWNTVVWPACLVAGAAIPVVSVAAYLFNATDLVKISASTGQAITTALSLLLLVGATAAARPDRPPLEWLLDRPDRQSLLRITAVLAGFPIVVALARLAVAALGVSEQAAWAAAIALGTVVVGTVTFQLSQRQQKQLILNDRASREQADAERVFRILADNAVDIVVHLRGTEVAWVSPSVEAAFGGTPQDWIGSDITDRIHRQDLEVLDTALRRIAAGESVLQRFRVRADHGGFHWVDGRGKPYVDADGNADGLIASLRIVDEQVEAEQRLDRLARFDTLTGLANRAEAIARLELALEHPSESGTHLGLLYCDVDDFKDINDTWGHGVGDTVLTTLATRIVECVRPEDTVGRTGGDEILVLLPGIHSLEEAVSIAEKVRLRAAEPIRAAGHTIRTTLSIGATIAVPGEHVSAITARADAAMYQAKLGAKNNVIRIEAAD